MGRGARREREVEASQPARPAPLVEPLRPGGRPSSAASRPPQYRGCRRWESAETRVGDGPAAPGRRQEALCPCSSESDSHGPVVPGRRTEPGSGCVIRAGWAWSRGRWRRGVTDLSCGDGVPARQPHLTSFSVFDSSALFYFEREQVRCPPFNSLFKTQFLGDW